MPEVVVVLPPRKEMMAGTMKRPVYEPVSAHELNKDPHDQDVMARSNMHLTEEEEYTHTHTHTRPYHNVLPLNFHFSDHGSGHQLRLISAVGFSLQMSLKGRKIILVHMLTTRETLWCHHDGCEGTYTPYRVNL